MRMVERDVPEIPVLAEVPETCSSAWMKPGAGCASNFMKCGKVGFSFSSFCSLLFCIFECLENMDKKTFLTSQLIFSECNFNLIHPLPPWNTTCPGTISIICITVPPSPQSRGEQEGPPATRPHLKAGAACSSSALPLA